MTIIYTKKPCPIYKKLLLPPPGHLQAGIIIFIKLFPESVRRNRNFYFGNFFPCQLSSVAQ